MIFTGIMGITASLRNNLFVSNLNSRKREKKKNSQLFTLMYYSPFYETLLWPKYLFIDLFKIYLLIYWSDFLQKWRGSLNKKQWGLIITYFIPATHLQTISKLFKYT